MQCLWITLADPDPATNGQLIYSKGLIEAARRAGASLAVIGLARPRTRGRHADPRGIELAACATRGRSLPGGGCCRARSACGASAAFAGHGGRCSSEALAERSWDAVVFDSICAAMGAAPRPAPSRPQRLRPPRIVYIAHNHEITVARRIAEAARGPAPCA